MIFAFRSNVGPITAKSTEHPVTNNSATRDFAAAQRIRFRRPEPTTEPTAGPTTSHEPTDHRLGHRPATTHATRARHAADAQHTGHATATEPTELSTTATTVYAAEYTTSGCGPNHIGPTTTSGPSPTPHGPSAATVEHAEANVGPTSNRITTANVEPTSLANGWTDVIPSAFANVATAAVFSSTRVADSVATESFRPAELSSVSSTATVKRATATESRGDSKSPTTHVPTTGL